MQDQRGERRPRGKYSRLICRGCRSRKIKCVLPNPNEIQPSGLPQAAGKSCERCCNLNLECIVEPTSLGRPAAKRILRTDSHSSRHGSHTEAGVGPAGTVHVPVTGTTSTPSNLEIKGYLYSEDIADHSLIMQNDCGLSPSELHVTISSKQEIFQSMIEPDCFLSSILANDKIFGSAIPHSTSPRDVRPLLDLISHDMASSLDACLVWHRFFLPQTPTLVSLRNRLSSDECASSNCATNLLFALLCLIAFESPENPFGQKHPRLKRGIQLALSSYGQEFIFSPPTHRDSVVVSLLLSDYRPAAIVSSQNVAHKAIKSGLYVTIAYRIAERLELLPTQASLNLGELKAVEFFGSEICLTDVLQGLQVFCYDALLDGFITKPLRLMRKVVSCIKPHIEVYQNVLKYRSCPPRTVYHIQNTVATYIMLQALVDMKQSWSSLESLSIITEDCEKKCLEQVEHTDCLLARLSSYGNQNELLVVRSLLEIRFRSVYTAISGAGLFYAAVLRTRLQASGRVGTDPEIYCHEAVQLGAQVIDTCKKSISSEKALSLSAFMGRFGGPYPDKLGAILEMFIECAEKLALNGVAFHPPPRQLVLEIVFACKNIVENNVIQFKSFGRLHAAFERQLALFEKCARRIESMVVSDWNSMDAAFAGGCVYAASSKTIHGLCEVMENLKIRASKETNGTEKPSMLEGPTNSSGLDFEFPSGGWDLWPEVGGFDIFGTLQGQFDWSSVQSPFPEFESTSTSFGNRIE
ncbi:hypothetical protein EMPG_13777 [Blastomyces silverae]|uniref:Zn(2)-C6 fungal-type domain-containing protein n=1 Tax=Blastomyces silverae TaxID=2060906 RepID=A0A0H1BHS3_9EURO|nr:hypothetical protein EMPG_13777 [Blastomyces silverae]